jgi:subtilisin family serine protease
MKQYNVILKKDVDYDSFWNDIESDTDGGKLYIPNRAVEFTNERLGSLRQCWYLLTDEEAELLRQDDRVLGVEIPPEHRDDIVMLPRATQTGNFTKTTSDSGTFLNWGLIRSSNPTNVYGTGTTTALNYEYTLDGTGVDVVIQDSGLQVDHPEFQDGSGNTRVQQIDWSDYSAGFVQDANHYRDFDGHGTHCAGIACGKTYGWAKEARVYSQKLSGLEGSGDSGTGISITYAFDAIKTWHTSKAGSRPTVVNMSWGYGTFYNTVTSLTYRGVTYSDGSTTGNASYRFSNYGLNSSSGSPFATYIANVRIASVDTDIEEMIDAGVVVCIAAGNRGTKIDVFGGLDYNNFVTTNSGIKYYHRGSSPYSDRALMVGSIDSTVYDINNDQKATYSETGPGVSIWAPGTNIMSACSNTNAFGGQSYYLNASFKQVNISGTSMAAPQVAGVAALALQLNPTYTPTQVKSSLVENASDDIYTTGNTTDYSNTRSLLGSGIKMLYSSFTQAPISGGPTALVVKGGGLRITADIRMV